MCLKQHRVTGCAALCIAFVGIAGNAHKSVYAVGENKPFELMHGDLVRRLVFTFCYDFDFFVLFLLLLVGAMPKSFCVVFCTSNKKII